MEISVPPFVKRPSSDRVTFEVFACKNKKFISNVKNSACYGQYMKNLSQYIFQCKPNNGSSNLPGECFLYLIDLCKKHGMMPADTIGVVEDRCNYLSFDGSKTDRHIAYTTLCWYRWCDSKPDFIYRFIRMIDEYPHLTIWEILHYSLIKEGISASAHSFVNMSTVSIYSTVALQNNLAVSIAMKLFYSDSYKKFREGSGYAMSAQCIKNYANNLGKPLTFAKIDDLLSGKFTPLYKLDNPTKKTLHALYKEIISGKLNQKNDIFIGEV